MNQAPQTGLWAFSPERIDDPLARQQLAAMEAFVSGPANSAGPAKHRIRDKINALIIGIEVSPLNEVGRFGALGVAMATSRSNPAIAAAAIGAATAVFEVPAAYAAADALENSETLRVSIDRINNFTGNLKERLDIPRDTQTSTLTKVGLAYLGGSAVSEIVRHKEEPSRTYEQNRRYGLTTAASLVGVSAVQGYLIAEGIAYPSPNRLALTALAAGTVIGAGKMLKSWVRRENRRPPRMRILEHE